MADNGRCRICRSINMDTMLEDPMSEVCLDCQTRHVYARDGSLDEILTDFTDVRYLGEELDDRRETINRFYSVFEDILPLIDQATDELEGLDGEDDRVETAEAHLDDVGGRVREALESDR